MSNQCLWISISDYFKYHKNETKSVRELKAKGCILSDNKKYDNTLQRAKQIANNRAMTEGL
jgi:hypothetical protein